MSRFSKSPRERTLGDCGDVIFLHNEGTDLVTANFETKRDSPCQVIIKGFLNAVKHQTFEYL